MMFRFEKLDVWQKAVGFADRVYQATRIFLDGERFGLTSQTRRAAVSISSNIAEGCARSSNKDFARFVEITYGSLMEVVSQTQVALRPGFLKQAEQDELYGIAKQLARMSSGLKASLLRSQTYNLQPSTLNPQPSTMDPRPC